MRQRTAAKRPDKSQPPDRLLRPLVGVAIVLGIMIAILGAGLWAHPRPQAVEQAVDTRPSATPQPSPVPMTPPPCVRPQDWGIHVVHVGDTLYSLAQLYKTEVATLQRVNCLTSDTIVIDQELYVPGLAAEAPTAVPLPTEVVTSGGNPQSGTEGQYVNIILLGSDKRTGGTTWRTDTMIVMSVDTASDYVRLLSIPRDLWVDIPGHGEDRMNTADLWGEVAQTGGGPELVKQTIYQVLGIPIQYYVRIDFYGFMKIIDAVGGVDIEVSCPLPDIEFQPGLHHMDGEDALLYARSRKSTNDFDRSRRQRQILMALWQQHLNADLILRLPALWSAMKGTFQTDLPLSEVVRLARVGIKLKPNQILSASIGPWQVQDWVTPGGAAVLLPLPDKIQTLLTEFYAPPNTELLQKIDQTRIEVWNGSPQPDAGGQTATMLGWAGFQATNAGAIADQTYTETQIIVHNANQDVAEIVAQQLNLPASAIRYEPDPSSSADILVILGPEYDPCASG